MRTETCEWDRTTKFKPSTDHGGHDCEDGSRRYLEWTWDPDPSDSTYELFVGRKPAASLTG